MPKPSPLRKFPGSQARRDRSQIATARLKTPTPMETVNQIGFFGASGFISFGSPGHPEPPRQQPDIPEGDANRRAMRAHLDASGHLATEREITLGCELDFFLQDRMAVGDVDDVAPRTTPAAVAAPDAGEWIDRDLCSTDRPRDRSRGAADHADRVGALVTRGGNEPVLELETFPNESRNPPVRVGAGSDAVVTTSAGVQIDHQHRLAVDQPRLHRHLEV